MPVPVRPSAGLPDSKVTSHPHQDNLPVPDDLSELLGLLQDVQDTSADNKDQADKMVPRSQEVFADVSDAKRQLAAMPANMTRLEKDLEGE